MLPIIAPLLALADNVLDKFVEDKDLATKIKSEIALQAINSSNKELQGGIDIVLAEANGHSWLQRNWRPLTMLWLMGLVSMYWFGLTPDNLNEASIDNLFKLVQIGLGGYVVGRSGEKIMKEFKK